MSNIERAAEAPGAPSIVLDALGTVFKMRADNAEGLCITLASQQKGHIAEIERLYALVAAKDAEIERLTSGGEG
jgi:hypothetical protein